jgi:enoyl-CoA hydratase
MSDYETILTEVEDGVGIITLNRPERLNAMNHNLNHEMQDCMRKFDADREIGCVVITGAGERAFSAGGDIREQVSDESKDQEEVAKAKYKTRRGAYEISAADTPTIAMVNGLAHGGAAVLATMVDMRIGCERSEFRFLAAAYRRINATWTLPNQVGWPMAKELLFTARIVGAEEAYRIGLLNHLVPSEKLREKTMEIAKMIAGNHYDAVVGCKRLLLRNMTADLDQQWTNEQEYAKNEMTNALATEAFPEFLARKGIAAD